MAEVKIPSLQQPVGSQSAVLSGDGRSGTAGAISSQASQIGDAAKQKLTEQADARKSMVTSQLSEVASALEETAKSLEEKGVTGAHQVASVAAQSLRQFSDSIEGKSVDELLRDAGTKFRQSPGPMLLGCLALGFIGARLVRS